MSIFSPDNIKDSSLFPSASADLSLRAPTQGMYIKAPTTWGLKEPALEVRRLDPSAKLPEKAHVGDLGLDLFALEDVTLMPGLVTKIRTGIACNFPYGYGALVRDRSSVATKKEVFVVAGVIDQGYTGEIIVAFFNPGVPNINVDYGTNEYGGKYVTRVGMYDDGMVQFKAGEKIAQMILTPVCTFPIREVTDAQETTRGESGFGSTGS